MKANKRDRIVKVRLTNLEYEELTKASKSSKCMSDYFRQRVFRKGVGLIDPKEFIRSMDEICLEMKRIGNNINQLGFAEKTVFSGDKRVYMAEQFYDITRPVIREYHSKFIRQSVNVFHDNNGVVHSIGLEYTGPLNFMNFWLKEAGATPELKAVYGFGYKMVVE